MNHRAPRAALVAFGLSSMLALACSPQPLKMELVGEDQALLFGDVGQSRQMNVVVYDRDGEVINSPRIRWYSINSKIAEVSSSGLVVPKSEGKTTIVARSGFTQREIPVNVHYFAILEPSMRSKRR